MEKHKNETLTNGEANRLGDKIRAEKSNLSLDSLNKLQIFRTSHRDALSETFHTLLKLRKKPTNQTIVTYRIKRFESIIGKLSRYPDMDLARMWDIGGCRVIVRNNDEVYRFRDEIDKILNIRKQNDHIESPQKDGYKSLHLYVDAPNNKVIEIQIRNQEDHNWATLVEISDLIFDSGLKEYGRDKKLLRFHYLLSKRNRLIADEKLEISKIIYDYKYIDRLSEIFTRNYLEVREQWLNIESRPRHKYFLIETTKSDVPKIESFEKFNEAELCYFNKFKNNNNANVVLTHLPKPNYNQISIAYSNYILTMHSMKDELLKIIESIIFEALSNKEYLKFTKLYNLHVNITINHFGNSIREIYYNNNLSKKVSIRNKGWKVKKNAKDWQKENTKNLNYSLKNLERFQRKFTERMPKNRLIHFGIRKSVDFINWRYSKKIKRMIKIN